MSGVRCQVFGVRCQVSPVTFHMSLTPTATATTLSHYTHQDGSRRPKKTIVCKAIFHHFWPKISVLRPHSFHRYFTLKSKFEERGELPVHSEREAIWLSIHRNRGVGCPFEERVYQPPVIIQPTSLKKEEKILIILLPLPSFSFFERQRLGL